MICSEGKWTGQLQYFSYVRYRKETQYHKKKVTNTLPSAAGTITGDTNSCVSVPVL